MRKLFVAWKMAGWIGKAIAAGLIVSFLSIWTTGYIVNSYVELLLKQYHIPLETQPYVLSGVWGKLWGADQPDAAEATADKGSADRQKSADGASEGIAADDASTGDSDAAADQSAGAEDDAGSSGTGAAPGEGANADGPNSASAGGNGSEEESPLAVDAYGELDDGTLTDIGGGNGPKGDSAAAPNGTATGDANGTGDTATDRAGAAIGDGDGADGTGTDGAAADSGTGGDASHGDSAATGPTDGTFSADESGNGAGSQDGGTASEAETDGLAMSTDELNAAKDRISDADKDRLFDLMVGKLPQEALQTISGLLEEGLTDEELTQVQQIFAQYLNRDEYDEMMTIMKKY